MKLRVAVLGVALVGACVSSNAVDCTDGTVCPAGSVCATITLNTAMAVTWCVKPAQLGECVASAAPCAGDTGTCHDGVCVPNACGNNLTDVGEACDDGNTLASDGCSADCKSTEACGNLLVDVAVGETCDLGADAMDHDGCSSTCRHTEAPEWQPVGFASHLISAMAYDTARRRAVLFGGVTDLLSHQTVGDTWEWTGQRWIRRELASSPFARSGHALAYDAARHQTVLFGGPVADTWLLDDRGWTLASPATSPPARDSLAMAYDSTRRQVVVFGGDRSTMLGDTWAWDGTDWRQLAPTASPPATALAGMADDPTRGVLVMFGGVVGNATVNTIWEFDGQTWHAKTPSGGPSATARAKLAFDPVHARVMAIGGTTSPRMAWEWDGATWTRMPDLPVDGTDHAVTTDWTRARIVVHASDTVYEFDGTSWILRDQSAPLAPIAPSSLPPGRDYISAATDASHGRIVLFGGSSIASGLVGDTWLWDGTWRQVTTGAQPQPRVGSAMTYDPIHDEIVMFGGATLSGVLDETWIFKNGAWSTRTPSTRPPARRNAALGFDGSHVLLVGGESASYGAFVDAWIWDGATWMDVTAGMQPFGRIDPALGYDPIRKQTVLFGGYAPTSYAALGDTYIWDAVTHLWSQRDASVAPAPRTGAQLAWDASRRRLILAGGDDGSSADTTVWEWNDGWQFVPIRSPNPTRHYRSEVVPSIDSAGVILIRSSDDYIRPDDVWRLRWDGAFADELCSSRDTDGDGRVGCADADCWNLCTPTCPPGATCPAGPHCGDMVCDPALETCDRCPADCGACATSCGDGTCDGGETITTCPGDCTP